MQKASACGRLANGWWVWPEEVSLAEAPAPHPVGRQRQDHQAVFKHGQTRECGEQGHADGFKAAGFVRQCGPNQEHRHR